MMPLQSTHIEGSERRRFMRHPTTMSIACRCLGHSDVVQSSLRDASLGGLSFVSEHLFVKEDILALWFPAMNMTSPFSGVVVWCRELGGGKDGRRACGVRFRDVEMFSRVRVLEQICHIEAYRKTQAAQCRRHLSSNQAAEEWIERYASRFPR
jgi:hypothetical protein